MATLTKVTEPTDWVSPMVTVVRNGKLTICSDPKDINKAIRREHYPIPRVEEVVASMPGITTAPEIYKRIMDEMLEDISMAHELSWTTS